MKYKKIIPYINAESELGSSIVKKAVAYERNGADELFIYNYSVVFLEQDEFLSVIKDVTKQIDIPVIIGCSIKKLEDIKKALYTGASKVMIPYAKLIDTSIIKEGSKRFGKDKILVEFDVSEEKNDGILKSDELMETIMEYNIAGILLKHLYVSERNIDKIKNAPFPVYIRDSLLRNDIEMLLSIENIDGVATNYYENKDILKIKRSLSETGISLNTFQNMMNFSEMKKNNEELIPVIVQDYKTNDVLMLAYMNDEAYNNTIETGKMTYFSRSRNSLWVKGETSGNYQYVMSLSIDCDGDTILAKVKQIGSACHTGNRSCFYRELVKKEYDYVNPLDILNTVYNIILDRKMNPKEGSYTNYLFNSGIDKILKKCGEESSEIIIAAKNQDVDELQYEIADFMYHIMVLMAEKGLNWDDIVKELADRN